MNEADRPLENHEHALSPDELARLRRLLNGSPTNRIEPPDPYKNRNEAGLQSINSRLDLTQKAFAGVSLVAMAYIGYLFLKSTDVAVSVGRMETSLVSIGERFDRLDKRLEIIAAFMGRLRLRQRDSRSEAPQPKGGDGL